MSKALPEYRLVRSKRSTLAIHILPTGQVEVRAPLRLPQYRIEEFLQQKQDWVEQHARQASWNQALRRVYRPQYLPYLGAEYPVQRVDGMEEAAFDGQRFLLPQGEWREIFPAVEAMYQALARRELPPRLEHWAQVMETVPAGLRITGAQKRWGSCSGKNAVCLAWRLVLAHPDAVDYVAVHELAHIRRHDHSPAFWALVEHTLPDYRRRRALLGWAQEQSALW